MESLPNDILKASREEKIEFLDFLINDDESLFQDSFVVLEQLLADDDAEVRQLAVTALWDYPYVEVIDQLLDVIRHDPSQEVRSKAVVALGRFVYEGTMEDYEHPWGPEDLEYLPQVEFLRVSQFLLDLIRDDNQSLDTRRFAVEAISFLARPDVVEAIQAAYEHPDPKMKLSAIFAMGRSGNEIWASILLKELESSVPEMQYEATRAAGESYLREAAPILRRLAQSEDKMLAMEAIWSLGRAGGAGARFFLEECAASGDPELGEISEAALEELELSEMVEDMDGGSELVEECGFLGEDDEEDE
jgi:hypothetical protein